MSGKGNITQVIGAVVDVKYKMGRYKTEVYGALKDPSKQYTLPNGETFECLNLFYNILFIMVYYYYTLNDIFMYYVKVLHVEFIYILMFMLFYKIYYYLLYFISKTLTAM